MASDNRSFGSWFIAGRPEVRDQVTSSPDFQVWRSGLGTVVVDGVEYFIIGGDMLYDEGEIILQWARRVGIVSEEEVERQRRRGITDSET